MSRSRVDVERLTALRALAAEGRHREEIAHALGVSPTTVGEYAKKFGIVIASKVRRAFMPEMVEELRQMALAGRTTREIAQALQSTDKVVRDFARKNRIVIRRLSTEERAQVMRRVAESHQPVTCPPWVPADYRSEYRDYAANFGPVYAERAVRKLMADAA